MRKQENGKNQLEIQGIYYQGLILQGFNQPTSAADPGEAVIQYMPIIPIIAI